MSLLKTTLDMEILLADGLQVRWNPPVESWHDVAAFQAQIALRSQHGHVSDELCAECATALTTAAQLYRVAIAEGHYPKARQHYQASYAIREEFNDSEGRGSH